MGQRQNQERVGFWTFVIHTQKAQALTASFRSGLETKSKIVLLFVYLKREKKREISIIDPNLKDWRVAKMLRSSCSRILGLGQETKRVPSALLRFYHERVVDHYNNPRNVGSFDKNDPTVGTGLVGAPACGDVMKLQIKVDEQTGKIVDACFKTFGCGSAIASSSVGPYLFIFYLLLKISKSIKKIGDFGIIPAELLIWVVEFFLCFSPVLCPCARPSGVVCYFILLDWFLLFSLVSLEDHGSVLWV